MKEQVELLEKGLTLANNRGVFSLGDAAVLHAALMEVKNYVETYSDEILVPEVDELPDQKIKEDVDSNGV